MQTNKNDSLLPQILDITGGRYNIARDAMDIINDMSEDMDGYNLQNIKQKLALHAIHSALDKQKLPSE